MNASRNGGLILLGAICAATLACGTLQVSMEGTAAPSIGAPGTIEALQTQHAELVTMVATLAQPGASETSPVPNVTDTAVPPTTPPPVRIAFKDNTTVGTVSGSIAPGEVRRYAVEAFKGQPMFLYIASPSGDVTLSLSSDKGTTILAAGTDRSSWQGTLPESGDYYISVHAGAAAENYSLTVTIPLRLQFPQGADSATVSSRTVGGDNVSYTVFAFKDQVMSVTLQDLTGKAALSIYGFTDGRSFVKSDTGQKSYEFMLPSTQDYIIVVVPMRGNVVAYTMVVNIK